MSESWKISFRCKCRKIDGKYNPSKVTLKEQVSKYLTTNKQRLLDLPESLKVLRVSIGGCKPKAQGNDFERKIAKKLSSWWCQGEVPFRRTPNSGGWDKQVNDGTVQAVGDIFAPPNANFPFSVECKHRKAPINFFAPQNEGSDVMFDWWDQCCEDAKVAVKEPLLIMSCGRTEYVAYRGTGLEFLAHNETDQWSHQCVVVFKEQEKPYHFNVMLLKDFLQRFKSPYVSNCSDAGEKELKEEGK